MGGVGAMGKYAPLTAQDFARTMSRAAERGMNFLDTAPRYGDSEAVFGHYLKDHRSEWIVCTKIGYCGGGKKRQASAVEEIYQGFEQSLRRLQVDHVDLLLIHSIDQYGVAGEAIENVCKAGMIDAMIRLREQGKVRHLGVSGQLRELIPAVCSGHFEVALTYNSYNLLIREAQDELFSAAAACGVGVILGGAFYQGLLAGMGERLAAEKHRWFERQDPGFHQTQQLLERVKALAALVGGNAEALRRMAIRFTLTEPRVSVVISGMQRPEEVDENASAAEAGALSADEMKQIDRALANVEGHRPQWVWSSSL